MAITSARRASADVEPAASGPTVEAPDRARRLERRGGLPGGRAVVGGFLVAAAAVGVFAAYLDATGPPQHSWVVATNDVPAGHRLAEADLQLVAIDLPGPLTGRAFTDPADVVGAVTTAPVAEHDLLLATHLIRGNGAGYEHVSFPIDRARAVAGTLQPGDRIDILASFRGAEEPEVVAANVLVLDVEHDEAGLSVRSDLVLTVALQAPDDALALTHAISQGELLLVRTTARDVDRSDG